MLCGIDDDLARQATATPNRIRGLLTQIRPTPAALRRAGKTRVETLMRKHAPRVGERWTAEIFTALDEQTVVVSGTSAAGIVLPQLSLALAQTRAGRAELLSQVEKIVEAHPLHQLLTSMPAVGVRTEARVLTEVAGLGLQDRRTPGILRRAGPGGLAIGDLHPGRSFLEEGHLGSQASLVPVGVRGAQMQGPKFANLL